MAQVMGRKAVSPTTWQFAASAEAAAAEGHESTPAVEDADIDGALAAAEAERLQWHERPDKPQAGEVSDHAPWVKPARGSAPVASGAVGRKPFAAAVERAAANQPQDRAVQRTAGDIHAEIQQLRRQLMRAAKRIPKRPEKMKAAVNALLKHPDERKKPSARRAARQAGLEGELADKLAYHVPVEGETVNAGICLLRQAPFVSQLRQDEGWLRQVTGKHASLASLAKTLENARRSLFGRAAAPPNRRAQLAAHPQAPVARNGNRRGAWHADAWELEDLGHRIPDIAAKLGRSTNAVQKALSLRRKPDSA